MHLLSQLTVHFHERRLAEQLTDVEIVCREYSKYVRRASSLYNSKMSIDHYNVLYVSMHFQKDSMTPGCSVVASLLAVNY